MIDINILIIITVFSTCLATIIQVLQGVIPKNDGWISIGICIIIVTASLLLVNVSLSAGIGIILLTVFLIIPKWGLHRVNHLLETKSYQKSRQLLSRLMTLHFTRYWQNYHQLLLALELANRGDKNRAITLLNKNNNCLPIFRYRYQLFAYEISGNWQNCLQWFEQQIDQKVLFSDPLLVTYYIRCLGENGQVNQLFQNLLTVQSILLKRRKYTYISRIKLYAFAFSGQLVAIRQLFQSELSFYPEYLREFWLITAKTMIDQNNKNYENFIRKYVQHNHILKASLEWRLTKISIPLLERIKNTAYKNLYKMQFNNPEINVNTNNVKIKKNKTTLFLIMVNSLVFITQLSLGGSENLETLYQLGALVPLVILQGEVWRLVTANFLHYGWGHFLMNMVALYLIGNLLESYSNKYHYMMIYFLSGVGSMFAFSYLAFHTNKSDYILVGASASVMGLVGSLTAIFLRRWLQDKSSTNRTRLSIMIFVISLQLVTDSLIPQVSMLSHLFGLLIGFVIESLTGLFTTQRV